MKSINLSPDYIIDISGTSDGAQDKYKKDGIWYKIDGKKQEGFNEELVSRILSCSNMSEDQFVKYEQIFINGQPGCCSPDFNKSGEEDISIYRLYANTHGGDIARLLATMDMDDAMEFTMNFVKEQTGLDIREYLANVLALDQLILNTDRHMNNLCIIHDAINNKYRPAPIFDNGRSFFCGDKKYDDSISVSENMKHLVFRPFSASANLMVSYLRKYQTLKISRNSLQRLVSQMTDGIAKSVLEYQLINHNIKTITD